MSVLTYRRRRSRAVGPAEPGKDEHARWNLDEATPIAPERDALKRLGGGTWYELYLAWDARLCSLVVAKLLRPDQLHDARALDALVREAAMLERLAHPVLLRGFGAAVDAPYPHIVIEHLEGPTLRRLIGAETQVPLEQLLPTAVHVASALHYLSGERVVHLDVNPSSILMAVPPRLIDLSLARPFEQAVALRVPTGTDAYMAPEQCDPFSWRGPVGPSADVWGLGATLHHAISGEPPFAGREPRRFPQLVETPARLGRDVPAPVAGLVEAMLAQDPCVRPTAMDVVETLESVLFRM